MSGTPFVTPRRLIRHRRNSAVIITALVPKPINEDHITFHDVLDTTSGQIAGKEIIYVPLQEDPLVPSSSTTRAPLGSPEQLVYQLMTVHAATTSYKKY